MIRIEYEKGTLLIYCDEYAYLIGNLAHCVWDTRTNCYRMPGYQYHRLITALYREKVNYEDNARLYKNLTLSPAWSYKPFPYQEEAIESWVKEGKRGVIVLPTGTGKSFVASLAIARASRSTVVVVPTIDLMQQWYDILKSYFPSTEVGLIGGGYFEPKDFTVITYDSAYRHLENLGNQFGFIIFDECHHLPGETYQMGAQFAIAPYRLGLSATPERLDGSHRLLFDLIGPYVYRKMISEMSGDYLADYDVIEIKANLSQEEREAYKEHRKNYLDFIRFQRISLSQGWQQFIIACSQSKEGRKAFLSYLKQKEIAQASPAKLRILEKLLKRHHKERILIFTHDNATAYKISTQFLVPVITHQTKTKERHEYIMGFNSGKYSILSTSKVLNEGVNIPAANIGIILSGSGSVREHVQRLGRILRKYGDKKALLYEIVTEDTAEEFVSVRRRKHEAYQREKID
ncbi:MAG: DEAD/DEAH box helicase [Candidatus Brocadiae bacterium]|nr:DEAD/DEAH box helicase [Candidatus Brocadiia bacterium]